jgi:glycerol-3-phosphate dehydrogenase
MAQKPNDVLCRRIPLSFLNLEAAKKLIPEIIEILAAEHKWSDQRKKDELAESV